MKPPIIRLAAKLPCVGVLFLLTVVLSFPQQFISARAGNIQWINGEAFLNGTALLLRDGQYIQMENDQVLTTGKGYAELLLAPDAFLRLGENASLQMRRNNLADIRLELKQGSALIEISEKLKTDPIKVYFSDCIVEIKKVGLYRFDAEDRKLRVYGGDALAIIGKKKSRVKNGRMVFLEGRLKPEKFETKDADVLHLWAAQRSLALYAKNLFFAKPTNLRQSIWRPRSGGIYNPHYRVTVSSNADWNRYWLGAWSALMRRAQKTTRRMLADPGPLPVPPPIIPYPPDNQK